MASGRVLVVDDAEEVSDLLDVVLSAAGFDVKVEADGAAALETAQDWQPDVVVLDLGLPGLDGVEVCRRLRSFSHAYVLMLTGRSDEVDRVVGLTVGADDYVTKPFSPREVQARVEALMRRPRTTTAAAPAPPVAAQQQGRTFGDLVVDADAREVLVQGQQVELTRTEFAILDALTEQPRRVLSREQLRDRVWGGGWFGDDHAVDVHVSNLRRKLGAAGAASVVATVRGVGYRLSPGLLS